VWPRATAWQATRLRATRGTATQEAVRAKSLQAINPFFDPLKNLVEGWFAAIVKSTRFSVGRGVRFPRFRIAQNKGLILRNVLIVQATEAPILVRGVVVGTDEGLNFRTLKKAVDVVVVPTPRLL
jgi:hypothetical protein